MTNRREFLAGATALFGASVLSPTSALSSLTHGKSLVPTKGSAVPNYWCTWACQNYLYGQGAAELDATVLESSSGSELAQKLLDEKVLLGPGGWAGSFYTKLRSDLYLLLDHGWLAGGTATFELDETKFPSFRGPPAERLRLLNDAVRWNGWRAVALWCRDTPGGAADEQFVDWSMRAGITYWKIDGGDASGSVARARARLDAPLTLEHMHSEYPLNGDWRGEGRFGRQPWDSERVRVLRRTDVYRTYDTTEVLGIPTTLDRAAELLRGTAGHPEASAILNLEDEVYIAAILGCSMGVMRYPLRGLRLSGDPDVFFPGVRRIKERMDEVVRAVRWQRIAAPYSAGRGFVTLDPVILTDEWVFQRGQTFYVDAVGQRVRQGAPARIARNMELPEVRCDGVPPFVLCSRFPNDAAAIGTTERVLGDEGVLRPRADIRWNVGDAQGPFGVFGHFGSLTLVFDRPLRGRRVLAQDLAGVEAVDITDAIRVTRHEIVLPGELIDRVGRSSATPSDLSAPGLVLQV